MGIQQHVNGEASVWVGTGASSALQELGISENGVNMRLEMGTIDYHTDTFGPQTPFDVGYFLEQAWITCDLVDYDLAVLNAVTCRLLSGTTGLMSNAGSLLVQGGSTFRLLIKSTPSSTGLTTVEVCHNFLNAYLHASYDVTLGTVRNVYRCIFRALPQQTTGATSGTVLYNTTCS